MAVPQSSSSGGGGTRRRWHSGQGGAARTGRRGPVGGAEPIQRAPEGGGWREEGAPRRARWRRRSWRTARLPGRRGCSGFVLGEGESGEQRREGFVAQQKGEGRRCKERCGVSVAHGIEGRPWAAARAGACAMACGVGTSSHRAGQGHGKEAAVSQWRRDGVSCVLIMEDHEWSAASERPSCHSAPRLGQRRAALRGCRRAAVGT